MLADFFGGAKQGFHLFGSTIALFVQTALLTAAYFIGIGIVAVPAKIFRKQFLPFMTSKKNQKSYWIQREPPQKRGFERMF